MSGRRGWWRGNAVALVVLVPLLGAAAWTASSAFEQYYWNGSPRVPVVLPAGDTATYAGGTVEIAAPSADPRLTVDGGEPMTLPPGTRAWLVGLRLDGPAYAGCQIRLVDATGRTFLAGPAELGRSDQGASLGGCAAAGTAGAGGRSDGSGGAGQTGSDVSAYDSDMYFLLPDDATPVAVEFYTLAGLPRFLRVPLASGGS